MVTLFLFIYIFVLYGYNSIPIVWKHWIDLPINDTQLLVSTYNHSIFVIGGHINETTIYKINASLSNTSLSSSWKKLPTKGINPTPLEIKNDNYITINYYTYIISPSIEDKHIIYAYDHKLNEFSTQPFGDHPPIQAANPCVVYQKPYLYVIGGITQHNPSRINCISKVSIYNLNNQTWTDDTSNTLPITSCYAFCQIYNNNIYLFGGVISGTWPTYLQGVYAANIKNSSLIWHKVSNDSIENGILNSSSLLINNTIYVFSRGEVQTVEIKDKTNIIMKEIKNDVLTPKRCCSGNVYDNVSKLIYVIGGNNCNNDKIFYSTSQISQYMVPSNNNNNSLRLLTLKDWLYISFVVFVVLMCICCYVYGAKRNGNNKRKSTYRQLQGLQQNIIDDSNVIVDNEISKPSFGGANKSVDV